MTSPTNIRSPKPSNLF